MSPTVSLAVANLSTGHAIILLAVAGAFILFALVSSFVIPRRSPDFPGNRVGIYSGVAILFLIVMLASVIAFGKEKKKAEAATTPPTTTAQTTTSPGAATTPTTTSAGTTGDPVAGKKVFTSAGCSGCHILKDAGATGNVGPNLDQLKPSEAIVQHQVEVGGGAMPAFKGQLSATQIQDVAAYVSSAAGS